MQVSNFSNSISKPKTQISNYVSKQVSKNINNIRGKSNNSLQAEKDNASLANSFRKGLAKEKTKYKTTKNSRKLLLYNK